MATDKDKKPEKAAHDNPTSQPDPETLHKTDPQENMKGPISSAVNKVKDVMDENDDNDKVDREEDEKE